MAEKDTNKFSFWEEILRPVIIITVICLVVSGCLALTDSFTADKITARAKADEEKAMSALIDAENYKTVDLKETDATFTIAQKGGNDIGYIVKTSAKGYGGDVIVMTAIGTDKKILGVNILDVSGETPGLGQNAAQPDFPERFLGLSGEVKVTKNTPDKEKNEFGALTGATITSRAVEGAINKAFSAVEEYTEGGLGNEK